MRRPDMQRFRLTRTRTIAAGVVVVVASLVVAFTVANGSAQSSAPARPTGLADCREDPLLHVHDPLRLDLLAPCVAVKGKIRSIRLDGGYNEVKVKVQVAASDQRFLRPANRGLLVVDVIATDLGTVLLPPVGSDATFYGAWVLDKATKSVSLHPSWRVVPTNPTVRVVPAGGAAQASNLNARPLHESQTLAVSVKQPSVLSVGSPMTATVSAAWLKQQPLAPSTPGATTPRRAPAEIRLPASQVRLFTEITTITGSGVRWRARTTNTRGTATARLLALVVPGRYQLTVYAYADGQTARASSVFTVKGR